MKVTMALLIIGIMSTFSTCIGQTPQTDLNTIGTTEQDTLKQMNLLDEQTKIFGQALALGGMSDEENPTGGATNYLEMINSMEASEELKKRIREIYNLYDTSLDPTKKAELKIKIAKMLNPAID